MSAPSPPPPRAARLRRFVPSAAAARSRDKEALEFRVWSRANTPLCAHPDDTHREHAYSYPTRTPVTPIFDVFPLTDQKAAARKMQRDLLNHLRNTFTGRYSRSVRERFLVVSHLCWQEMLRAPFVLLWEILGPPFLFVLLLVLAFTRVCLWLGIRGPMLSLGAFLSTSPIMVGRESLSSGENGYTRVFSGGTHVSEHELQQELLTRNVSDCVPTFLWPPITICVSYKHYAANDGQRICRQDVRALGMLLKQAGPCRVRFWVDSKLPKTSDTSFERWVARGVTPYGRYITFVCPSAMRERQSSFWVCNEFHFAVSGKGVIYMKEKELFYELRYAYQLPLYRRFLEIITGAALDWDRVRETDREKALRWAMCCLSWNRDYGDSQMSPKIDCLSMSEEPERNQFSMLMKLEKVVDQLGELQLPIVRGRSWNKENPLLLKGYPIMNGEVECLWYGVMIDDKRTIFFFPILYASLIASETLREKVVLEVRLNKPFSSDGQIEVCSKVLRKISCAVLKKATYVTLPWLCEWQ